MKISILGCGWLGLELGKRLREDNHEVRGSVTRMERMTTLREAGIIPFSIKLYEKGIQGDIRSFLSKSDVLIVDIPPGLRKNPKIDFVKKIRNLIPYIEKSALPRLIFTSSTSVYQDAEDFPVYTEETTTDNSSDTAIQIRNAELLFLNNENFKTLILRFGGLIGKDRHPVKYLSGKKGISNPEAPVNLVHQGDCITAILKLIENEKENSVWNLVYPEHPTKADYYSRIASQKGLELPEFDHSKPSKGKKISSEKFINEFGFKFEHSIF